MRRAQDQVFAFAMEFVVEVFEGVEAGGVHGDHFAHAQDEHLGFLLLAFEHAFQLVHRAEKESAHHAIDHDALGDFLANQRMLGALGFGALVHRHDLGGFR